MHKMAIPYHLVAEAILLAIHSLRGEFGNFHMCLHIEVQFTVPTTLTMCSALTRRKSLEGLTNSASVLRMLTVGWSRGMLWLVVTSNNLPTLKNLVHVHFLHSQQGFFSWPVDCRLQLVFAVLPLTVFNTFCVGVLRVTQEGKADYISAHVPPYSDAINLVGMHQVLPWRARDLHWGHQLICTHHNVFLLHDGRHGTAVPEVPLVEEIHHHSADGMIPAS